MDYAIGQLLLNKFDKSVWRIDKYIKNHSRPSERFVLTDIHRTFIKKYLYRDQLDEYYIKIDSLEMVEILYG